MDKLLRRIRHSFDRMVDFWWGDGLAHQVPALAFYLVLSLAPLALALASVASVILGNSLHSGSVIAELSKFFPPEIRQLILKLGDSTQHASPRLITLAVLSLLWVLSGALGVMERAMLRINSSPPYSFLWGKIRLLLLSALLGLMILVGLVASILAGGLSDSLAASLSIDPRVLSLVLTLFTLVGTICSLALLYHLLPKNRTPWRCCWRAAPPAAVILLATPYILGKYFAAGSHLTPTGIFLSLAVIMTSCMFIANGLLLGAGLAASSHRRSRASSTSESP